MEKEFAIAESADFTTLLSVWWRFVFLLSLERPSFLEAILASWMSTELTVLQIFRLLKLKLTCEALVDEDSLFSRLSQIKDSFSHWVLVRDSLHKELPWLFSQSINFVVLQLWCDSGLSMFLSKLSLEVVLVAKQLRKWKKFWLCLFWHTDHDT